MNISDMKSTNQLKKRNQITVTVHIKNIKVKCRASGNRYPRDRNAEFEPKIVPRYKRDISEIENKIIAMYARGMSTREINEQIQEIYGFEVSAEMVSKITDKILPEIEEWQKRPLERFIR